MVKHMMTDTTAETKNETSKKQHPFSLPTSKDEIVRLLQLIPHPEGGYFRETWRSGVIPMHSRGQTDISGVTRPRHDLVMTYRNNRPNDDGRRHGLTSIFWVPTLQSPKLLLAVNDSDHVHYYQGGLAMEYFLYEPSLITLTGDQGDSSVPSSSLTRVVLGPNLYEGQQLQVAVAGGTWKCGRILQQDKSSVEEEQNLENEVEYSIIGEAVGPGFDFHDFNWITLEQIEEQQEHLDEDSREFLKEFCHPMNQNSTLKENDAHYDDDAGDGEHKQSINS